MTPGRHATGLGRAHDAPPLRLLAAAWWPRVAVWALMMALIGGSLLATYLRLGRWQFPLLVGIAVIQAGLVAWFFMQVNKASTLNRLTSVSAFVFIAVMFSMTFADLFNRF